MLDEKFVIVGALLSIIGCTSYIVDTLKGKAKPNRVSFFFWGLAPLIAFSAEIKQGVGWVSLMTFMVGFCPILILIASFFNKNSYWKLTKFDLICGVFSLMGLILWQIIKIGNVAILFSILSDGLASTPTIKKSFYDPDSESWLAYFMGAFSALITMLTIKSWNFQNYAFPIYILLVDILIFVFVKFKIGKNLSK